MPGQECGPGRHGRVPHSRDTRPRCAVLSQPRSAGGRGYPQPGWTERPSPTGLFGPLATTGRQPGVVA
jgi:hypothetical protein